MYQLPEQFLRGSPEVPLQWRACPIDRALTSQEWVSLNYFRWRAGEFLSNVEDLKLPSGLSGSMRYHYVNGSKVYKGEFSTNAWPGRFRAKSVFMDFRPLILSKAGDSRSNLNRTRNIISRSTNDRLLRAFVNQVSSEFLKETTELSIDSRLADHDRTISIEALLHLWMNVFYFHNGTAEQIRKVADVLSIFQREGIEQLLLFQLVRLAHYVRCVFAVVEHAEPKNRYFACPDTRIIES